MDEGQYPAPESKAQLLHWITEAHDELERTTALLRFEQVEEPLLEGGRSVKDVLAHITEWEQLTLARLAARHDRDALDRAEKDLKSKGTDDVNDGFFRRNKGRALPDVRRDFNRSYEEIVQATADLPEEDLLQKGLSLVWDGAPLWGIIGANTYAHYREHTAQVQALVDSGK
jgi:hypothetical protein